MNDLGDRLAQHLHHTAEFAEPAPDVDAVLREMPRPRLGDRVRRRSWVPAAAAVALVVAGIVGLVALTNGRSPSASDQPTAPAAPPATTTTAPATQTVITELEPPSTTPVLSAEPTLFPVVEEPPPGLPITARAERMGDGWTSPRTEALVGRRVDGVLTDAVQITVQSEPVDISPMQGRTSTETVVMGQPANVHDHSNSGQNLYLVTWGSGPYFIASGEAPLAFLDTATPDAITAAVSSSNDEPPQVTFGTLPDGFEVIAPPLPITGRATIFATLSIGSDNYDISVHTNNPLIAMAAAHPLRSIDVNGRPAWTFLSSEPTQDITWQVDDSTYMYLKVNDGTNAAGALELAEKITYVDFDTWTARYSPNTVDTPATTEPADS